MAGQIVKRLRPEEEEILKKREELASLRACLADRELELVDLRSQLAVFEGKYLREVGVLYAELDDWKARISELRARLDPSGPARERAEADRQQAERAFEEAHADAARTRECVASAELKNLFRETAKRIHPDFCSDAGDLERRTRLMAEANRAYEAGDEEKLRQILNQVDDSGDREGEGIGAELIRVIRQISQAKERVASIEQELRILGETEIAQLKRDSDEVEKKGRDLLAELAASLRGRIQSAGDEYQALLKELEAR